MIVELISFSFQKNSLPNANYLIDVRFLNNPFYVDKLQLLTGLDDEVIEFFEEDKESRNFLRHLYKWIEYIVEINQERKKEKIVIAIGCTGGQHRSPYIVQKLAKHLTKKKLATQLSIYHLELMKYNETIPV